MLGFKNLKKGSYLANKIFFQFESYDSQLMKIFLLHNQPIIHYTIDLNSQMKKREEVIFDTILSRYGSLYFVQGKIY